MKEPSDFEKLKMHQWMARQEEKKINRRSTADHRHNWKDGKKVRIFGSEHHVHCAVPGCEDFKVVGG